MKGPLIARRANEERLDFLGVGRLARRLEVRRQIDPSGTICAKLERVSAPIAAVMRCAHEVDEPVAHDERACVVGPALEDLLQIREHPHRHRPSIDGTEKRAQGIAWRNALALGPPRVEPLGQSEEILARERPTEMKGIGEVTPRAADADEEVPRKPHAVDDEADTASNGHHHDGQGDGDAKSPVEHLVQVAVARVVVADVVAAETELVEQARPEHVGPRAHARRRRHRRADRLRDGVELGAVSGDIEARVRVGCNRQRHLLDARLVLGEGTGEGPAAHEATLHGSSECCNLCPMLVGDPVHPKLTWIRTLKDLEEARATGLPGERIRAVARAGKRLGDALRAGPRVVGVKTLDVTTLPYPTRFAFNGAVPLPWPFVLLTHRTLLVRLETREGRKHVLWNPTDADAARKTPFFQQFAASLETRFSFAERLLAKPFPSLEGQLAAVGVRPEDIDAIAFDHFHTQDVRPLLSGGDGGRFPNAVLLAPAREWEAWDSLHPMQRAWMIEDGKRDVPADRVVTFDADLMLGDGCLLLRTPGHTVGNQTIFVHGAEGVFGCSENGCSADNWAPRASNIPGLAGYAAQYDVDVVLNANTPEFGGQQYESMMLERSVVDPVPGRPDLVQMFPSSEVTASAIAPLVKPTLELRHRDSGAFARA